MTISPSSFLALAVLVFSGGFAWAQDEGIQDSVTVTEEAAVIEEDPVTPEINTEMENKPYVRLRSLDKVTARAMTFDAQVGTTVTFGNLYIRVQTCRQSQPIEEPESAAFLQVWEDLVAKESSATENTNWVFSGWMFASSPGLSHMDHPVYDVWVMDCLDAPSKSGDKPQAVQETSGDSADSDSVSEETPEEPTDSAE